MEKYGFVYLWYDRKHKRYYIGCHWGTEDDGYVCSSTWVRDSYKRRPHDFKRRILIRTNIRENLFQLEDYYLNMIESNEFGKKYYNLQKHWKHWSEKEQTRLSVSEKISIKTKEAMLNPNIREKYLQGLKNRNNRSSDPEVREKRRKSMLGKNKGKDTSKAVAAAAKINRGRKLSAEHKDKISKKSYFKMSVCDICGFEGNVATIARYHNDKCKHK